MEQLYKKKEIFISAYDQYAGAIFRYCAFKIFDRERAKELMQETFTKTWEYLNQGREIENIKAFLYKVAHNLCVNEAIRHKTFSLEEMMENIGFDQKDESFRSPEDRAEIDLLLSNMQMLKFNEKEILTMRYINDLKVSDMALILEASPNTVSVRLRRAEEKLKAIYKKNGKQF